MDYLLELKLKLCSRAKCFRGQEMTPSVVINKTGPSHGWRQRRKRRALLVAYWTGVCGTCDLDASYNQ